MAGVVSPLPSPADLGGPSHGTSWRAGQDHALDLMLKDRRKIQVLSLPTGTGKTLVYLTDAAYNGSKRYVILTATRALQDQVIADAREMGLLDVRGMQNYPCVVEGGTADEGSCNDGATCWAKAGGCAYFDAVRAAEGARLVVTNYAFWFSRRANHQDLGKVDVLVCDEAHEIPTEMERFLNVVLKDSECAWPPGAGAFDQGAWAAWAASCIPVINDRMRATRSKWDKKALRGLRDRFTTVAGMGSDPNPWVIERVTAGWAFQPLWPGPYLERWLWGSIPRVVLSSATITRPALERMGVRDYHFIEMPSPIPVAQRPVFYLPTGQIKYNADEETLWRWLQVMDAIIEGRLDRKGIIHAVSYDRARYIVENSRWKDIMVMHDSRGAREAVKAFKTADPPAVLVSPSVTTGHDFPDDAARYQIIAKVPFLPPSALLKARTAQDRKYPYHAALTTLVQMAGRIVRSPQDIGESFVVDAMAGWLVRNNAASAPRYFRQAWREIKEIPRPPRIRLTSVNPG